MNKQEFLGALKKRLSGLPKNEIEERLAFYGEMIDDRTEDGRTEEEAVAEIGGADEIAAQIIADIPLTRLVKEKIKPKRRLKTWEIVLIVLGSPIWLSLAIAAAAVFFSMYIRALLADRCAVVGIRFADCRGNCRRAGVYRDVCARQRGFGFGGAFGRTDFSGTVHFYGVRVQGGDGEYFRSYEKICAFREKMFY